MAKHKTSGPRKAINAALARKPFASPESAANKKVRASLQALDASCAALENCFESRATQRRSRAEAAKAAALKNARERLADARRHAADMRKTGDKDLIANAHQWETIAKGNADMVRDDTLAKTANAISDAVDAKFRKWYDDLVVLTVQVLSDDAVSDTAIGVLSGGLIVVGVVGGPPAALAAAAAASAILIGDMRAKLRKVADADRDIARRERAIVLLNSVKEIGDRWLSILCSTPA